jgi:ribosomal protein S18 acetylase RimI-like enzyme
VIDPSQVQYRDAVASDASALADFWRETFTATFGALYTVANLKRFIAESYGADLQAAEIADPDTHNHLALEDDGSGSARIIGAAKLGLYKLPMAPDCVQPIELHRFYLAEEAKGTGVADALMAWAFARGRREGADAIYLGVFQQNERAQRFYARHGFKIVGDYLFEVADARDEEWIMRAEL